MQWFPTMTPIFLNLQIIKNAKIVFDTRNVIKFKSKKVEKL